MDTKLLAKALGAIASYSLSREVARVRVVFCDAAHYDQGYMAPEAIAARVRVRGRGRHDSATGHRLVATRARLSQRRAAAHHHRRLYRSPHHPQPAAACLPDTQGRRLAVCPQRRGVLL